MRYNGIKWVGDYPSPPDVNSICYQARVAAKNEEASYAKEGERQQEEFLLSLFGAEGVKQIEREDNKYIICSYSFGLFFHCERKSYYIYSFDLRVSGRAFTLAEFRGLLIQLDNLAILHLKYKNLPWYKKIFNFVFEVPKPV